jgi:HSP20 family protein
MYKIEIKKEVNMTLVRWNKNSQYPSVLLDRLFENFFGSDFLGKYANQVTIPSVNVTEKNDSYEVEVAAPGYKKDDFKVSLENNILTISAEVKNESEKSDKKELIKEYHYASFERSFTLPDTILTDKIEAKYENGILKLLLPKKEEAKVLGPKTIQIS